MKYIKEYSEHSTYEQIWVFKYGESPTFDRIRTLTIHDVNKVKKVLDIPHLFKYKSQLELEPFFFISWPIWLIDTGDKNQVEWINKWGEILDHNMDNYKTDPIYKNKQIGFTCQTKDPYFYGSGYRMFKVDIMCDNDDYYYVHIDLPYADTQTEKLGKYYKCDQEYGISECLKTELQNWEFR